MASSPEHPPNAPRRPPVPGDTLDDALDAAVIVRARAQLTHRRVLRVDRLSREHIAADLAQIER